jgi:hypothetical protein
MTRFSLGGLLSFWAGFFEGTGFRVEALVFLAAIFRVNAKNGSFWKLQKTPEKGELALNMNLLSIMINGYLGFLK